MKEVGCHECIGACCTRLMQLPLTAQEAEILQDAGTVLEMLVDPGRNAASLNDAHTPYEQSLHDIARRLPVGTGLFQLLTDCAYLEPVKDGMAKCSLFGQAERPAICSTFSAGSSTCRTVRLTRGLWDY